MDTPNIGYVRRELLSLQSRYDIVRDCVSGQEAIKAKGVAYLPKPNEGDTSDDNKIRYKQYLARALFYNVTGHTLAGLIGQIFKKDPVLVCPESLSNIKTNIDGAGVSLDQQAKGALSNVMQFGRCGLLVDYPKTEGPVSKAALDAGEVFPTITLWQPWDIINWRTEAVGGKVKLSLVVISEMGVTDDDGFEMEVDQQYRVLRLINGVYVVQIWVPDNTGPNKYKIIQEEIPLDSSGNPWNEIPFIFVGSKNNDTNPDLPPLYDLACLNVAHYRNSADYEESCYLVGQPTPYVAGLTEAWVQDVMKGVVAIGSRAIIALPVGGSAGLLQASPNVMPFEAMKHKESQMVALGAKLVEQKAVQQTATEAGINASSEASILATCAGNVSQAYTKALQWACNFLGEGSEVKYTLQSDFGESFTTPQARAQTVAEWQAGAITTEEMRRQALRSGIGFLPLEDYKAQVETQHIDLGIVNPPDNTGDNNKDSQTP